MPNKILHSRVAGQYGHREHFVSNLGIISDLFIARGFIITQWYEFEGEKSLLNQLTSILNQEEPNDYREVLKQMETPANKKSTHRNN